MENWIRDSFLNMNYQGDYVLQPVCFYHMLWFSGNQALHCDERLPGRASFLWNSIGLRRQGSAVPDCTFVPAPAAPAAGLFSAALLLLSDKLHFKGTGRLHMADIHRTEKAAHFTAVDPLVDPVHHSDGLLSGMLCKSPAGSRWGKAASLKEKSCQIIHIQQYHK